MPRHLISDVREWIDEIPTAIEQIAIIRATVEVAPIAQRLGIRPRMQEVRGSSPRLGRVTGKPTQKPLEGWAPCNQGPPASRAPRREIPSGPKDSSESKQTKKNYVTDVNGFGVGLPVTRPAWDSNLGPPASEIGPLTTEPSVQLSQSHSVWLAKTSRTLVSALAREAAVHCKLSHW